MSDCNFVDLVELLQQRREVMPIVDFTAPSSLSSLGVSDGAAFQKVLSAAPHLVNMLGAKMVKRVTAHAHSAKYLPPTGVLIVIVVLLILLFLSVGVRDRRRLARRE